MCGNANKIRSSDSTTREEDVFVGKSKRTEVQVKPVSEEYCAASIRSSLAVRLDQMRGLI